MSVKLFKILLGVSISFLLVFSSIAEICPAMNDLSTSAMNQRSDEHSCDEVKKQHSTPTQNNENGCCDCMVAITCEVSHHMINSSCSSTHTYTTPKTTILSAVTYLPPISVLKKRNPNRSFDLAYSIYYLSADLPFAHLIGQTGYNLPYPKLNF